MPSSTAPGGPDDADRPEAAAPTRQDGTPSPTDTPETGEQPGATAAARQDGRSDPHRQPTGTAPPARNPPTPLPPQADAIGTGQPAADPEEPEAAAAAREDGTPPPAEPDPPRTNAPPQPAAPTPGRGGSWVGRRLRAAPAGAVATALLVLVTAFLAAALPRAVDRYEDNSLRHTVTGAAPRDRGISLSDAYTQTAGGGPTGQLEPGSVDGVERTFQELVRPPLRLAKGQAVYGVRTGTEADVPDRGPARLSPHDPGANLVAQAGLAGHVRVLSGRLPRSEVNGGDDSEPLTMEAAVTRQTAQALRLKVGETVHLSLLSPTPMTVRISGIVAARDPDSVYWHEDTDLLAPEVVTPPTPPGGDPKPYWHFTLLVDRGAAAAMPLLGADVSLYWHHPLDPGRLTAHDLPALQRELSSFASGPDADALTSDSGSPSLQATVGVGGVLETFAADREATGPLVLIAAVGVGATAFAVLLMAGGLAAERRREEIALLRSRGGGLRGIFGRLAGETAAVSVPAGAAGALLALLLLPTARLGRSLELGALVVAVAVLALPLRAVAAHRRPRPPVREDLAQARPSRRRLVAELTLTVLVVGAVAALRRRGTDGGADPFLAAAPVLVAVAAALVLLRLYPLPLRWLARPAARLRGAVTYLGLARAGRSPAAGQLPLLALLVALTVASFGGSVLAGVDHARDRAAAEGVGADARIDARSALAPGLPAEVAKIAGVGEVTAVRIEPNGPNPLFGAPYSLVTVDPAAYARVTRAVGLPAFPASVFAGDKGRGPLPAVVSPKLAAAMGGAPNTIDTGVGFTDVVADATVSSTPATPGDEFVIVSAQQLNERHRDRAGYRQFSGPTTLLATNAPGERVDGRALRASVAHGSADDPYATVQLRSEERSALRDSPLQKGARDVYLSAIAAAAGYSALALLLTLLQTAPGRSAVLARLRTMGMTRRQSRRLVLLEALPQAVLAAVGGVLVGLAVVPLLRPGVDLHALTSGSAPRTLPPVDVPLALRADPWSLALPSAGLLILACAVLLAQAWVTSRRRESAELRAGERA